MEKPVFKPWANAVTLWYEHCPGANEAKQQALIQTELETMKRLASMAEPIANEIGELSVQLTALEFRREALSKLYKELEKQYNEISASYDNRLNGK
ncbi:hypothetical protein [Paenibacillus tyrfis]|uniref:Uncharacterized protein n=1 Tax=Paenibacillus tyrfis TaxID=1501230 RepID=A0A081NY84_9BACL|nr:hypothetical protein [Paenibacillus tyrfis]KEQ23407.1 hypothetical protein ET33_16375 [Paenibacillus tyrfis]